MRGLIKVKISDILAKVIDHWRLQASIDLKNGRSKELVTQTINNNIQTLVRIVIELSVEISVTDFLFTDIYQQFKDINYGDMFANEAKPYILSGQFAEWSAPEHVLNFHILQHH
jgi:hypothetical protein